jgi:hypothetical protein
MPSELRIRRDSYATAGHEMGISTMRKLGPAVACCLALFLSGCIQTSHYLFGGDEYAVTDDGGGRVTVRNLRTGAVVEESRGGHGAFAKKLLIEGELTFESANQGDVIKGGAPTPARSETMASPGPILRRPRAGPPFRNDIASALVGEPGGGGE